MMIQASCIALLFTLLSLGATNAAASDESSSIILEDFSSPLHSWKAMNDPVMGGESTSTVTLDNGLSIFDGKVVDVPFLDAPGFITMKTRGGSYPDVSTCTGLELSLRAKEAYDGYRISFGNVHVPGGRFAFGYKANFDAPVSDEKIATVAIPFTDFSAKWDDATGDQIVTCQEESKYCPTVKALRDLRTMTIWGEGVAGNVHLEIKSIKAVGCGASGGNSSSTTATTTTTTTTSRQPAPKKSPFDDFIMLESFDVAEHAWTVLNDPVMGGESEGKISMGVDFASFEGKVVNVPFLHAPGFISMTSVDGHYPDVSSCTALKLILMQRTEEYKGFRVSFGLVHLPSGHHAVGYKANFKAPVDEFDEVVIPFTDFSAAWDDATGDQIVTCAQEPKYCPDQATLQDMATISIWGEGVAGNVHLKIKSISAVGCKGESDEHTVEEEVEELVEDMLGSEASSSHVMEPEKAETARGSGGFGSLLFVALSVAAIYVIASKRRRSNAYDPVDGINMKVMG